MAVNFLTNRSSHLSQFKAIAINYSTLSGSTIVASTLTNISTVSVSTIYDSTLNANSITVTSTIATSTMTVSGSLNVSGPLQIYGNQLIPIGCIMLFYSSSIPAGWALCNGQTVTRTDGGGTITTPNLIGQFVYGGSTANTSPQGSSTQTLAVTNLPSHNHGLSSSTTSITTNNSTTSISINNSKTGVTTSSATTGVTDSGHTHMDNRIYGSYTPYPYVVGYPNGTAGYRSGDVYVGSASANIVDPGHAHTISDSGHVHGITDSGHTHGITDPGHSHTVQNTGSGTAFSIMPPYIVLCYIMKY